MAEDTDIKIIDISDLAARREVRSVANPLKDPNVKVVARGVDFESGRKPKIYNGIEIPNSAALYNEDQLRFGGKPVREVLANVSLDSEMPGQTVREFISSMGKRLLAARSTYIFTNVKNPDRRAEEVRKLADHTWGIANEENIPGLKDDIIRLLTDTFGPSRAGKILERMSSISRIQTTNERKSRKALFRVIK